MKTYGCSLFVALLAVTAGCGESSGSDTDSPDAAEEADATGDVDAVETDASAGEDGGAEPDVSEEDSPDAEPYEFVRYAGLDEAPDFVNDRLCAGSDDPEGLEEKIFIECELEGANFAVDGLEVPDELIVMTYNMERGVRFDEQLDGILNDERWPVPDIFLINEIDRGCSRSGGRNPMWELAEALEMDYVYAVEFVELPRGSGSGGQISETCEHGNAIASRYPIGNVRPIRHRSQKSWYQPPGSSGEPRLGGRIAVAADILLGDEVVTVYSIHYESSPADNEVRDDQALETAELGVADGRPVIVAGDTNAPFYFLQLQGFDAEELTVSPFLDRGFVDAHAPLPFEERGTRGGLVIDLILGLDVSFSDPVVCPAELCEPLSDHLPVWATMRLGE